MSTTDIITRARQFKTRDECAAWCKENPSRSDWEPTQHGFVKTEREKSKNQSLRN